MTDGPTAPDACLLDAISGLLDALALALEYIQSLPADRHFDKHARGVVLDRAAAAIEAIRQATGETE